MKQMSNRGLVVGIGELLWDCFKDEKRIGGAPANFAYHAAQFGYSGIVISAIGRDDDGEALICELESHKLNYHLERLELPTGTVIIDDSVANQPKYTINTDVAWSAIPYTEELADIASECRAVCYGTLAQYGGETKQTIRLFLTSVPRGCYKIYDINLRENSGQPLYDTETIDSSITLCNVLKVNIDELIYLSKLFDLSGADVIEGVEVLASSLMAKYDNIEILIVTMDVRGSWMFSKADSSYQETPKVIVRDTVGAGDSFCGSAVACLMNGKTLKEAHRIAVKVAAYVCTQPEGMPVIPEHIKR